VATGGAHTGVLLTSGAVYMWGSNQYGQLGIGSASTGPIGTPTLVSFPRGTTVTSLVAGLYHSAAITSDTSLYMWGSNSFGALGIGPTHSTENQPTQLNGTGYTGVSLGWDFTCALQGSGTMYCWGYNNYCQTTDALTTASGDFTPYLVNQSDFDDLAVSAVSVGGETSAAIDSNGTLWIWGSNAYGQLAQKSSDSSTHCTPSSLFSASSKVSVGSNSVCTILQDGTLYCWGSNFYGQVGDGTSGPGNDAYYPISVPLSPVTDISVGYNFTYAIYAGSVYGWGTDQNCELLNVTGISGSQDTPVRLPGLSGSLALISQGTSAEAGCAVISA
jgi:alpha-tubulin suppressor-like RCC1 family protein